MDHPSNGNAKSNGGGGSIEKIYQKKTQLEHILLRPDTYIGSVERLEQEMWIWSGDRMVKKNIKYVPGLFKIFDEILVNAADNKIRDPSMSVIKVTIDKEQNLIKVYNNGKGIPVVEHKVEKVFVPTLIFGHLLTSSNYNDDEKKVTGGRNGYGAKLCNIFSTKFIVETSCKETNKYFKQTWIENMGKTQAPVIKPAKDEDFTCVSFWPDLSKFSMTELEDDTVALLARRVYDVAASTRGVKVYLNDKKLPISKFEDYCKLFVGLNDNSTGEVDIFTNNSGKIIYESPNNRWEVAVAYSDVGFQQMSFVNSIATTKGGRHVDYVCDQIVKHLGEVVNKKSGKNSTQVKPFQIKSHIWLFVNCLIENPVFESQTKESMSSQIKNFGSKCQLSEDFLKKVAARSGVVDRVLNWLAFKDKVELEKTGARSKQSKIKGIPKLDDANNAGTRDSLNCTLILTEGDSAKTLAVAGLGVIGRDRYGVFPLRGKMLNVREATTKQILDNAEISSLCRIIGLNFKEKYETRDSMKQLRYGKIMIMTDQDHDGSHIKGLIVNFIHYHWPNLLKQNFVEQFITPIIKVSKNQASSGGRGGLIEKAFYSVPEFEEWQKSTPDWHTWKIKYYKGLGTSTSKEAKEYFSDMVRHCIHFEYSGLRDDLAIQLAFNKRLVDERKEWLTRYMEARKSGNPESYLYQKDTRKINFTQFVNKELVLFSNLDNERSIPSLVDGFKPGQRKVLFSCFKRNLQKEIKVAQLAGSVAELSSYHHGEQSLMSTIINLAQNFVGSNNLNLLQPIGQFGTRLHGGKDAASPRYIFTNLSPLTRYLFNAKDDPLLNYINDDGQFVEPDFYCPILPMVLVNGAEGIGTGWAVKIPNYDVRGVISNLLRLLKKQDLVEMKPHYKNFRGCIDKIDDTKYLVSGEIAILDDDDEGGKKGNDMHSVEITELPVGVWTQWYKESVLEPYLTGETSQTNDAKSGQAGAASSTTANQPLIADYKEYHTDCTVRFVVRLTGKQFQHASQQGLHKFFKLQKQISLNNMVLFDSKGCLRKYDSPLDILKEFYEVRLRMYGKRKEYLESMFGAECAKLDMIARFIVEKCDNKIKVENLKRNDLIKMLGDRGYLSDPVKKWKEKIGKEKGYVHESVANLDKDEETSDVDSKSNQDFNYLLSMPLWNLTLEKKEEILKQQKQKSAELKALQAKTPEQLWLDDLDEFKTELDKFEQKEKEDAQITIKKSISKSSKGGSNSALSSIKYEYLPTTDAERIDPPKIEQAAAKTEQHGQKTKKEDALSIVQILNDEHEELSEEKQNELKEIVANLANPNRLKVKATATPKKSVKKEKTDNENETQGDTSINASQLEKKTPTKKTTKAAKSSDEGDESKKEKLKRPKKEKITVDSDSEASFDDDLATTPAAKSINVPKRETGRARKQVKYNFDDDSDKDEGSEAEFVPVDHGDVRATNGDSDTDLSGIDTDSDVKPKRKVKEPKAEKAKKPTPVKKQATTPPKKQAKAKPASKKSKQSDDDEDEYSFDDENDSDFEFGGNKKQPKGAKESKPKGKTAAAKRKVEDDDDVKKPTKKAPVSKKSKKSQDDNNKSLNITLPSFIEEDSLDRRISLNFQ